MTQYGFFFDQSRCYGCKACSVACKDWYDIAPGPEKWMSVYMWEKGRFPNPSIGILAFNCGHCDNPVCAAACENGAIFKEDKYGAVLIDQDKCKGDRHCFEACPYGAPKFASDEPGTKMSKCTMCIDRLENDQLPLCVASCPMRALDFGPIDELREKYGDVSQIETMPPDFDQPELGREGQSAQGAAHSLRCREGHRVDEAAHRHRRRVRGRPRERHRVRCRRRVHLRASHEERHGCRGHGSHLERPGLIPL